MFAVVQNFPRRYRAQAQKRKIALIPIDRERGYGGWQTMHEGEKKHAIALTQEHVLLHVKMRFYKSL